MRNQDTVRISFEINEGAEGVDGDQSNPLNLALNKLFSKKSDSNFRLKQYFFNTNSIAPLIDLRWFGVFVYTAGGKILFFPGTTFRANKIQAYKGENKQWEQNFNFDHITLDRSFTNCHITTQGSTKHLGSPRTLDLGKNRILWFGFTIESPMVLKKLYKKTIISFPSPPKDAERRINEFHKSREGIEFPILSINDDFHPHNCPYKDHAYHFTVVVGEKGFEKYLGDNLAFPHGGPYIANYPIGKKHMLLSKTFKSALSDSIDLQITTNIIPGKLLHPCTITFQEEPR